jgi:predicted nucleic acid-binding protein
MIVFDSNVIIALAVKDHDRHTLANTAAKAERNVVVPPLWRSEMRSGLVKYVWAKELTIDAAAKAYATAVKRFAKCEVQPDTKRVLETVEEFGVSVYDAEYLSLATSLGCLVLTNDAKTLADLAPLQCVRLTSYVKP